MIMKFVEKYLGGHMNFFNHRLTIYGANAMHWAVNIRTRRWGYVCFRLPFRCFRRWWPLYFYVSPNATPWASTFYVGGDDGEQGNAKRRRQLYGHNFDIDLLRD